MEVGGYLAGAAEATARDNTDRSQPATNFPLLGGGRMKRRTLLAGMAAVIGSAVIGLVAEAKPRRVPQAKLRTDTYSDIYSEIY